MFPATAALPQANKGDAIRARVTAYPCYEGPYGTRGLGGNSRDWCGNVWLRGGPTLERGRLVVETASLAIPSPTEDAGFRAVRGGAWSGLLGWSRSATRFGNRPHLRRSSTGLRLARSL